MRVIGNILWFIFTGLIYAICFSLAGLILCITVIGIPFGLQCFKIAGFVIFPFGKEVNTNFGKHPVANMIWVIVFGWEFAVGWLVSGLIWCITIIGIPFGKQCFKLMQLGLLPFGATYQ